MIGLSILFLVAAIAFGLSHRFNLPAIPLLIGGGIAISVFSPPLSPELLIDVVTLGLTFLVFSAGTELNPARLRALGSVVLAVSLTQFFVIGIVGFSTAVALGYTLLPSVYLGAALATSSTLVVLRHLRRRQQRFEPFGRMVIGTLLIQDIIMIFVIVILVRAPEGPSSLLAGLGGALLIGGIAYLAQRWIVPRLISRYELDDETLLLCLMASLFLFLGLVVELKLPLVAGGFAAGFSFSGYPVNGLVRGVLNSLSDFFLATFFTGLGAMLQIPTGTGLLTCLLLAAIVLLLTPPLVIAVSEYYGFTSRAAIDSGLLLAQNSEFSLFLALSALGFGHIGHDTFSVIAMITILTMILSPFLASDRMTRWLLHWHPLRQRIVTEPAHQGHVVLLGFGAAGMWVVTPLLQAGHDVVVVDDDPAVIDHLQHSGIPCLRGDGSDERILKRCGAHQAKLILASMRRVADAEKVLRFIHGKVPVVVRVFEEEDAQEIERLGGIPILNSAAAADTFFEWFYASGLAESSQSTASASTDHASR